MNFTSTERFWLRQAVARRRDALEAKLKGSTAGSRRQLAEVELLALADVADKLRAEQVPLQFGDAG